MFQILLVILYDISCVILQNPAFFFYKILQEFLLGNAFLQLQNFQVKLAAYRGVTKAPRLKKQ